MDKFYEHNLNNQRKTDEKINKNNLKNVYCTLRTQIKFNQMSYETADTKPFSAHSQL